LPASLLLQIDEEVLTGVERDVDVRGRARIRGPGGRPGASVERERDRRAAGRGGVLDR